MLFNDNNRLKWQHSLHSEGGEDPMILKHAGVHDGLRSVVIYVAASVQPDLWDGTAGCVSRPRERTAAARLMHAVKRIHPKLRNTAGWLKRLLETLRTASVSSQASIPEGRQIISYPAGNQLHSSTENNSIWCVLAHVCVCESVHECVFTAACNCQ